MKQQGPTVQSGSTRLPRKAASRLALAATLCVFLAGCKEELYTELTEREANEIVSVLQSQGISANKQRTGRDGGIDVHVDSARFADAVRILNARGLPRQRYDSISDVFDGAEMVTSPTAERARLMYALSQELSRTIAEIDGVLSARVHVVLPETDALDRAATPSSASVVVRRDSKIDIGAFIPEIKMLVSNSIEGLSYEQVSVTDITVVVPPLPDMPIASSNSSFGMPSGTLIYGILGFCLVLVAGAVAFATHHYRRANAAESQLAGTRVREKRPAAPPSLESAE